MTLWHKLTKSAKGSGLVVVKNGKNVGVMTAYEHRSQAPAGKWCYLTELLKLEQENKSLQEKLEIAIEALEFYANESHFGDTQYGINGENECWYEGNVENGTKAQEALAKIKEIK